LAFRTVLEPKFAIRDWEPGGCHEETNAPKSLVIAITMALLAGEVGFFLVGAKESGQARADKGATTETTAAAVGAQVAPTDPKLRVEPK
jgi:hypothetical protein